ncbi:glyoxalase [Solihabitans fulvus]|uniref:Glyoxalase n=1 Tax=Solihabitans fulvus TaxID=1892852 RepID=A0A5B2XQN3_9PSEU|nr:VOC family protein [Solihabitans fulvus]KAA2265726.1 glyoxalase [Solihabitans fulvus]
MTDPFDALRLPVTPVTPDPRFAERLRARLERALLEPRSTPMTTTTDQAALDVPLATLTPYLAVDDARGALDFYVEAFGARRRGEPIVMEDGRIGHAELAVGGSVLMLADEFPELGLLGPRARGGVSQSLRLQVADVDEAVRRAMQRGAALVRAVADYPHGRQGAVDDPFGHRWILASAPTAARPAEPEPVPGHGDVAYITHVVPDTAAARRFYGEVLGWRYAAGSAEDGWHIEGTAPMAGLGGGATRPEVQLCYQVDDLAEALRRVREQGGEAGEPAPRPYGLMADCVDNQGARFYLLQSS